MKLILFLKNNRTITLLSILLISLSLTFWSFTDRDFKLTKNLDIFFSLIREINVFYVDEKDPEDIIRHGIEGVLNALDPYTTFIPESEKESFETMTTGRYGGIGAQIQKKDEYYLITDIYENFPAHKSGVLIGDVITEIDGEPVSGLKPEQASEKLKGLPGSTIELSLKRPGEDEVRKISVKREEIRLNSVTYHGIIGDNTGYIRLSRFTEDAHKDVKTAFEELKINTEISSLVLDLRGNPGGLMREAVLISNFFVDKGSTIVSTKGKIEQWNNVYKAENEPVDSDIPLIILVNNNSASASEIIAGAIQDLDRGVIVGQRTFGKGLVQTTRPLSYNAQIKITTARYYTPSGRSIQAHDFSGSSEKPDTNNPTYTEVSDYKTMNGRIVTGGGGITPDIELSPEKLSHLAATLYSRNIIFDFATLYTLNNKSIPAPEEFSLSDEEYDDFIDYLGNIEFDYESQSEKKLNELIETAKNENYYNISKDEFSALKRKLVNNLERDLLTFKGQIKELIEDEITGRYYFKSGRIKSSLNNDPVINNAIEIMDNKSYYYSLLQP